MTQRRLEADLTDITGRSTHLVLDVYGVIKLPTRDPMSTVIYEAACTAEIDGEPGAAQFETHWPGSYLRYLADRGEGG